MDDDTLNAAELCRVELHVGLDDVSRLGDNRSTAASNDATREVEQRALAVIDAACNGKGGGSASHSIDTQ